MKAQNKAQSVCDVSVYSDKKSLALRFPKRHSTLWELLDGKSLKGKPKCLGIGKYGYSDTPEDWKRATQLAIAMEADLDHPEWEKLFDPTLAKYGLGGGKYAKLADVLQLPGTVQPEPEMTVGQMWEEYLVWKEGQIEESTFRAKYCSTFTNSIKRCLVDKITFWNCLLSADMADFVSAVSLAEETKKGLIAALNEAFLRVQSSGKTKLTASPFYGLTKALKADTRDKYKPVMNSGGNILQWWEVADAKNESTLEADKRAFTKNERDIIIKAFYDSSNAPERQIAPLIEFLFLTGCRPGEAFALTWGNIKFDNDIIFFGKSYSASIKKVKVTKNNSIRIFKLYPRLRDLLLRIKPADPKTNDLVFKQQKGQTYTSTRQSQLWMGYTNVNKQDETVFYPGVVARLVEEGEISSYLSPYHTRHTYITLTAWANKGDTSALMLLAHACENSVEVILRHYLGINKEVELNQP
ncbi:MULTISPECIES: tyrosine-type recombinase/integrase [unclassified Microcoleus]|uniref:tyrosine-type recombinase/integrase n=1 Tax=unclassified Microcoleus TaxID=2642155 RepID=UPI002FD28730